MLVRKRVTNFGPILRYTRQQRGLTRRDLWTKLNERGYPYSRSAISRWETNERDPELVTVQCISEALELDQSEAIGLYNAAGYLYPIPIEGLEDAALLWLQNSPIAPHAVAAIDTMWRTLIQAFVKEEEGTEDVYVQNRQDQEGH